jgi:hypothetical protein
LVTVGLAALILVGCASRSQPGFAIHLLSGEASTRDLSGTDIDELDLQEEPILSMDDFVAYHWADHEIELTGEAYKRIQDLYELPVRVDGLPFVVSVGSERIYAGAFWTPVSSLIFDGVIIGQPFDPDSRTITIGLGYPTTEAFAGPDPRSDERIQQSLEQAGKLSQ